MTTTPETAKELRRRAEEQFSADNATTETLSTEEIQQLFHELRVHQIELEMQNEELRRAQHELEATRFRYFDLYDLAPVAYLTLNNNGLIQEANLTAATMLGVARKALLQNPMSKFIFTEDQDVYYRRRKQLVETGEAQGWEMRLARADGSPFWAHLQAHAHNCNCEYMVTFSDITERKRMEEDGVKLQQQFQQAQKMESLGVLAGGIAHDFNNLLTVIIGHCGLAMMKPELAVDHIVQIENAANRAAELCRQMLIYAGKASFALAQVDIAALVYDMAKMLKTTNQNVAIQLDLPDDIPRITGDASQIRQVVMNLIINACESIGEAQGEVRVFLTKTEIREGKAEKDCLGKSIPSGRYVCLEVTDTGCGMNDETILRVFEPFYSTKFTGRGLGMSAVLGILAAHKGALQLSSRPGLGTSFKVYLPVQISDPAAADLLLQQTLSVEWQGSGTILLVEDEEQILDFAKTMLEMFGFIVITASNGMEALELYLENTEQINLVVTDLGMPIMDGYTLFSELKKLNPDLPIIISSGFGDTDVLSRIAGGKASGFLDKPYSFDQMRKVLKRVAG